jgi:hypothetical protein
MVKVVSIINFWDGENILPHAVKQWHKLGVDVIIVYSNISNYRTVKNNSALLSKPEYKDCILYKCEPRDSLQPVDNERMKRNYGLQKARELGYTHFITADADELYESVDVDYDAAGTVVACQTYFKSPTLTIGLDVTLVPFVHKITANIAHAWNRTYPYAFDKNGGIRIDPSRQLNINDGVSFNDKIVMHHYSYVRDNINSKMENSTARNNIRKSVVLNDMENAKPGYFCKYYQKTLTEVPNQFGI